MKHNILVVMAALAGSAFAQQQPLIFSNDKLELTVKTTGGTLSKLVRKGAEPLSPYHSLGHFLALDGFGAPSDEEKATGMPFHGEASKQTFKIVSQHDGGPTHSLSLQASLPLAQEVLTRTLEMNDGESVIYVTSELESLIGVDRPITWAEHATLGPPFLDKGKTVVDMPAVNCRVRAQKPGNLPNRLVYLKDFKWPMAPAVAGGQADLRSVPADKASLDLASCQMDPTQKLAFVTALHPEKHLLFGYVFRREDYPWVMNWMNYTGTNGAARGMEFSSQPFDVSHREAVDAGSMFGTPTYRWLAAKAKIQTRFLIFYTEVPEGFSRVDKVTMDGGKLTIEDSTSGKQVVLAAAKTL